MTYDNIGSVIRYFRKQKGLSQELLSRNICSREQLIRIEKGTSVPSFFTLSLISAKLGVDFSKYFEFLEYENPIEVFNYFETFQKLHYLRYYNELYLHLNEFKSKYYISKYHELSLIWYECMCDAHINKTFEKNFNILSKAILNAYEFNGTFISFLDTQINPDDFKIINSLAVFKIFMNEFDCGYEILDKCAIKVLTKYREVHPYIIIPILLNFSKMLFNKKLFNDCIEYCDKSIDLIIEKDSLVLLGDFYALKANCLEELNQRDLAVKFHGYYIYYYEMKKQSDTIKKDKELLNSQFNNIYF